ncbi:ribonuclease H-like domain-containing protein [Tanacetum coccineum]
MGLRPNAPPGFQQTQPHQPTFGFNGHQQALYSAAVQNQSASSGSTSQETQLPHAFNTLTLQDPAKSNRIMDTGASFTLTLQFIILVISLILSYIHLISGLVKFSSDVTARVTFIQSRLRVPQAFLVGQQTCAQRLGHPGSEVLRSLVSNNLISCNKTQSSVLCHVCQLGKHVRLPFSLSETIVKAPCLF